MSRRVLASISNDQGNDENIRDAYDFFPSGRFQILQPRGPYAYGDGRIPITRCECHEAKLYVADVVALYLLDGEI
jgi:hypothetical protein